MPNKTLYIVADNIIVLRIIVPASLSVSSILARIDYSTSGPSTPTGHLAKTHMPQTHLPTPAHPHTHTPNPHPHPPCRCHC